MSIKANYHEFSWQAASPANGDVGRRLTDTFVRLVSRLDGVKRICDLGCGNGYMAGQLAALGYEVTGVDASACGIDIARQHYARPEFICSMIDSTLLDAAGLRDFDLVTSSDVIEHFYRPADLLEAATGILRPEGQILIGTPYHGYLKNLALSVTGKMDAHFHRAG